MPTGFMHLADVHLGYRQYNLKARAEDIARAFRFACESALHNGCKFILVSGDLFHGNAMTASTLLQAVVSLRDIDVPVILIPGNHDRARVGDDLGWLHALPILSPQVRVFDVPVDITRAPMEIDGVRIVGIPYLGPGLVDVIPKMREWLSSYPRKYTILMMHAGLEGEMPGFRQPLTMDDLKPLRGLVDYIALGHLHKPFQRDNWLFNPGSLEALSVDESQYQGGWYIVDVDGLQHQVKFVPYANRRPFLRLKLDVTELNDAKDVEDAVRDLPYLPGASAGIVEVTLIGHLRFPRVSLDLAVLSEAVAADCRPLRAWVRDMTTMDEVEIETREDVSRTQLERDVLKQLVARDPDKRREAEYWAHVILQLKEQALAKDTPGQIAMMAQGYMDMIEEDRRCS